ncbi:MAG: glycosyltransferase [Bacteroidia bacterium]
MQLQKRILVCPLDWGLGHATRCIPIINLLLEKNVEVFIAADGRPYELLKLEFPTLAFIRLKGYGIQYSNHIPMVLKMGFSIFSILKGIKEEHKLLQQIIKQHKIDVVISDNRFGLWSKNTRTIFITHQLMIKAPFWEKWIHRTNLKFINKFNECWVPDEEGSNNLSGDLSHKYALPKSTVFIGLLSRFNLKTKADNAPLDSTLISKKYDVMAIISGPEPQRTFFEKIILEQLLKEKVKALVVRGITEKEEKKSIKRNFNELVIVSHLKSNEMQEAIEQSELIIARSGYSTIMDMAALGKKVFFIPTKGQTEQEYLAKRLMDNGISYMQPQREFDLRKGLLESKKYKGFDKTAYNYELDKKLTLILNE